MSLPYAFCVELGRVIDIVEAHEVYFSKLESKRERLTFQCPDAKCREAAQPVITGVNYDKLPGKDKFVQKPHFRLTKDSPHAAGCPWCELVAAIDELEGDATSPKVANLKRTELITVFKPLAEAEGPNAGDDFGALRTILATPDPSERRTRLHGFLNGSLNKTSRLHEAARCFEAMSDEERKTTPFRIGDMKVRTYRDYFAPARFCSNEHYWNRIYFGPANVKQYPSGYSIRFESKSRLQDGTFCTVSVFVPKEHLDSFRGKVLLRAAFDDAVDMGKGAIYCYAFGDVTRAAKDGTPTNRIDIRLASLHSLAVKLNGGE